MNLRHSILLTLAGSSLLLTPAWATYENASNCPYCQAFDTLATSGTATWRNDMSGFTGWFIQSTSASFNGNVSGLTYSAGTGTSSITGIYSFGTSGASSDRSLGAVAGTASIAFGHLLRNDTANTLTSLTISYTGEQWRSASTSVQSLQFSYAVAAGAGGTFFDVAAVGARGYLSPAVVSGSDAAGDNKGLNWVAASSGNFTAPTLSNSGSVFASTAINFTLTGLNIPAGSSIMLRWLDVQGNTDGLALDNVCVSVPVPEPSTYAAGAAVVLMVGGAVLRRRSSRKD